MSIFLEWAQHLVAISLFGFIVIFFGGALLDDALSESNWIKIKKIVTHFGTNRGFLGIAWVFILISNVVLVVVTGFRNLFIYLGYEQIPISVSLFGLAAWWLLGVFASRKKQD